MAVLTESALRSLFLNKQMNESVMKLPEGTILTPAAKSYLQEKKIVIEFDGQKKQEKKEEKTEMNSDTEEQEDRSCSTTYRLVQGGYLNEKPEHMTTLHSNLLVHKDHKRIILRGKLDSLEAKIMETQMKLADKNFSKLADDLSEVLNFVRQILRSEVMDEELMNFEVLKMDEKELREMSHQPEKYFGEGHFSPDYKMGIGMVLMNSIRTFVRETEIIAYQAYKDEEGNTKRDDIMLALNRLSSLCLVLMFKIKTGYYTEEKGGR